MTDLTAVDVPRVAGSPEVRGRRRLKAALLYDGMAWLALLGFVVAVLGTSLLGRTTFFATDVIEMFDPWRSVDPGPSGALNPWLGDTIDTVGPSNALVAEAVRGGDFPQWNPFVVGGVALLPVPDNGALSPLTLPWYLVPHSYAPGLVKLLEIVTITVGMSLLGRRWGLRSGSWAIAALVFTSSGFMIAWTNWSQTRVAAFIPLLFWAVDRFASRTRARDLIPVAVVIAAMVAGGFPAITGWALYFAGGFLVVRLAASRSGLRESVGRLALAGVAVVAGLALSAWQLLPFVRTTLASVDLDARAQRGGELDWWAFAGSVAPTIFGGPTGPDFPLNRNPIEAFSYIGAAAVVVLVVGGLLRIPSRRTVGVSAAVYGGLGLSIMLTYLGGPMLRMVQFLPVFSNNSVPRLRVIVGFLAALAVMLGFDAVMARTLRGGARGPVRTIAQVWRWVGVAAAVALLMLVAAAVLMVLGLIDEDLRPWAVREVWVVVGIMVGAGGMMALGVILGPRRGGAALVALVLPVLIAVPAASAARSYWPQASPDFFYPETDTHEFLRANLGHDRYGNVGTATLPGSSSAFGLRSVNGHSFHSPAWKDMLLLADEDVMVSKTLSSFSADNIEETLASPILDRLAVRYLVTYPWWDPDGDWESTGSGRRVVEVENGDRFSGTVRGPFRGIAFNLPDGLDVGGAGVEVLVTVATAGGVIAEVRQVVDYDVEVAGVSIPVPVEGIAEDERVQVTVSFEGLPRPLRAVSYGGPGLVGAVQRPPADDVSVVAAGGALILERESALPRIRWASGAIVHEEAAARLEALNSTALPDDTVVLSAQPVGTGPRGGAEVTVLEDGYDLIRVRVVAAGAGWLVVADNISGVEGWTATVDGAPAGLVAADHVGGAVALPEGEHEVVLAYSAPGLPAGLAVSVVIGTILLGIVVAGRRRTRARRGGVGASG